MSRVIKFSDVAAFGKEQVTKKMKQVGFSLTNELVTASAIDKGFLAGSWLFSVGTPSGVRYDTDYGGNKNAAVSASYSRIAAELGKLTDKDLVAYLQNNQPYAYRIMEDGYSEQTSPRTLSTAVARYQ